MQVAFDVEAGGLSDGTSALFVISAHLQGEGGGPVILGTAGPVIAQLGFSVRQGGDKPYTTQVPAQWILSEAAIERIEKIRWWRADPVAQFPVRADHNRDSTAELAAAAKAHPGAISRPADVKPHRWAQDVLEQWQLAAAVSVVVALPAGTATDDHRIVAARLATAKRLLQSGKPDDLKASVAASREACEVLRSMLPGTVNRQARARTMPEREAVILDKVRDLAQALFDYDSAASHPDAHLRDITWLREDAVLALCTAASLAQRIFARA